MSNNSLSLITNEPFGDVSCGFFRENVSGDVFLTREQIGLALEYENPRKAIKDIHLRHPERLDKYSIRVPIEKGGAQFAPHPLDGGTGGEKETVLYNRRGVFEICRWSQKPKADAFLDFVWEVMDRLMNKGYHLDKYRR